MSETNKPTQSDPLSALVASDTRAIDRSKLASFLTPYVQFDKDTKEISLLDAFNSIVSNDGKVEVILLASKARLLIFDIPEGLTPSELIKMDIMPEGSIKSSIKKLYDMRKIKKEANGSKYFIPNYRMNDIINRMSAGVV